MINLHGQPHSLAHSRNVSTSTITDVYFSFSFPTTLFDRSITLAETIDWRTKQLLILGLSGDVINGQKIGHICTSLSSKWF